MYKDTIKCERLVDAINAARPASFAPVGATGHWEQFVDTVNPEICMSAADAGYVLRMLAGYTLGTMESPIMLTAYHDSLDDDAPKMKLICFDLTYEQLLHFDETAQPSWFTCILEPRDALFTLKLTPTRSLMKLIYHLCQEAN